MEDKDGIGSKEPISKREKHTMLSRLNKTKRSNQLCFLIGLLTMITPVTIQRPRKKSRFTQQIFGVKSITIKEEIFDVESYLESRCPFEHTQSKNERHKHGEQKIMELFELLIDICTEYGFIFITTKMRNKLDRNKIDFIEEIYYHRTSLFTS